MMREGKGRKREIEVGEIEAWKKHGVVYREREITSEKLNYKYTMNTIHFCTCSTTSLAVSLTCEQLAILLMGSPTLGHHATSLTQSVWASSFSSRTQLSLSSL